MIDAPTRAAASASLAVVLLLTSMPVASTVVAAGPAPAPASVAGSAAASARASAAASAAAPAAAHDAPPRLPRRQLVEHLVRVAEREWRDWGRTTVDVRDGVSRVERIGAVETDRAWRDCAGGQRPPSSACASGRERRFDAAARVRRYWREGMGVSGRPSRADIDVDTAARTEPWSAVFVSWLMRSVGVSEDAFPATDRHATYLRAMPASAQFELRAADATALARGDLLCSPRDGAQEPGWVRLQAMRAPADVASLRAAHCDLVVSVDARRHEARLVGGNVEDSVAMTRITLTGDGRAIRTLARPFFVLVRSR
ncbi:MAG: DUF2272 domain-containing protein [Lautropia sp.]